MATRKQRKAQQRKMRATLTQARNVIRKLEDDKEYIRNLYLKAKESTHLRQKLPDDFAQKILDTAVHEVTRSMVVPVEHQIRAVHTHDNYIAESFLESMIIRSTGSPSAEWGTRIDTGDAYVTITIPEFRWTHILDRHLLENISGTKGPVHMPDRPIYVMEGHRNPLPYNGNKDVADTMSFETF